MTQAPQALTLQIPTLYTLNLTLNLYTPKPLTSTSPNPKPLYPQILPVPKLQPERIQGKKGSRPASVEVLFPQNPTNPEPLKP